MAYFPHTATATATATLDLAYHRRRVWLSENRIYTSWGTCDVFLSSRVGLINIWWWLSGTLIQHSFCLWSVAWGFYRYRTAVVLPSGCDYLIISSPDRYSAISPSTLWRLAEPQAKPWRRAALQLFWSPTNTCKIRLEEPVVRSSLCTHLWNFISYFVSGLDLFCVTCGPRIPTTWWSPQECLWSCMQYQNAS